MVFKLYEIVHTSMAGVGSIKMIGPAIPPQQYPGNTRGS